MNFMEAMTALQEGNMIYGPFDRYYHADAGGFFVKTHCELLKIDYYLMIDVEDWLEEDPSRSFMKLENISIKYGVLQKDAYKIVTKEEADQIAKEWKAKEDAKQ